MEIIDSQIHEPLPWLEQPQDTAVRNRLATEIALAAMDATGVDAAIWSTRDDLAEFAARQFPHRFAAISTAQPDGPATDDWVAELRSRPGLLGIRLVAGWPPDGLGLARLREGGHRRLLAAAERHGVPVCFFVSGGLPVMEDVARQYPDLSIVIDHFGIHQPPRIEPDDPPFLHLPELLALAQFPNVAVKFSGAPSLSLESYPYDDLWPHLAQVLEAFGPERLMWGSDIQRVQARVGHDTNNISGRQYPGRHTYAEALGYVLHTPRLSQGDKEKLFSASLRTWLKWPAHETASV